MPPKAGIVTLGHLRQAAREAVIASGRKRSIDRATNEMVLGVVQFDQSEIDELLAKPGTTGESRLMLQLEMERRRTGYPIKITDDGKVTEMPPKKQEPQWSFTEDVLVPDEKPKPAPKTARRRKSAAKPLPSGFTKDTPFEQVGTIYEGDLPKSVQQQAEKVLPTSGERRQCIDALVMNADGRGLTYAQALEAYKKCLTDDLPRPKGDAGGMQPMEVLIGRMRDTLDEMEWQVPSDVRRAPAKRDAAGNTTVISSPEDAVDVLRPTVEHLPQEQLRVLWLNTRNEVIGSHMAHQGTINSSAVAGADVFRPAMRAGAASIIIAHNHPSGDPLPSPEDIQTTRGLVAVGKELNIQVLDHVVIGDGRGFRSIKATTPDVFNVRGLAENPGGYGVAESGAGYVPRSRKAWIADLESASEAYRKADADYDPLATGDPRHQAKREARNEAFERLESVMNPESVPFQLKGGKKKSGKCGHADGKCDCPVKGRTAASSGRAKRKPAGGKVTVKVAA